MRLAFCCADNRVGRAADLRPGACDAAVVALPRTERLRRVGSRQAAHHVRAHHEPDLADTRAARSFVAHRLERSGVPDRCRGQRPGAGGVPAPRWHAALAAARAGGEAGEGPHVQQPGRLHAGHRRRARLRVLRLVRAAGLRLRGQGTMAEAAPGAPYPVRLRHVADRLRRQGHPPARWQRRPLRADGLRPADRRRDLAHGATVAARELVHTQRLDARRRPRDHHRRHRPGQRLCGERRRGAVVGGRADARADHGRRHRRRPAVRELQVRGLRVRSARRPAVGHPALALRQRQGRPAGGGRAARGRRHRAAPRGLKGDAGQLPSLAARPRHVRRRQERHRLQGRVRGECWRSSARTRTT